MIGGDLSSLVFLISEQWIVRLIKFDIQGLSRILFIFYVLSSPLLSNFHFQAGAFNDFKDASVRTLTIAGWVLTIAAIGFWNLALKREILGIKNKGKSKFMILKLVDLTALTFLFELFFFFLQIMQIGVGYLFFWCYMTKRAI